MAMGQFIDASLYFNECLEVLTRMHKTPRRKCLEIGKAKCIALAALSHRAGLVIPLLPESSVELRFLLIKECVFST